MQSIRINFESNKCRNIDRIVVKKHNHFSPFCLNPYYESFGVLCFFFSKQTKHASTAVGALNVDPFNASLNCSCDFGGTDQPCALSMVAKRLRDDNDDDGERAKQNARHGDEVELRKRERERELQENAKTVYRRIE